MQARNRQSSTSNSSSSDDQERVISFSRFEEEKIGDGDDIIDLEQSDSEGDDRPI